METRIGHWRLPKILRQLGVLTWPTWLGGGLGARCAERVALNDLQHVFDCSSVDGGARSSTVEIIKSNLAEKHSRSQNVLLRQR